MNHHYFERNVVTISENRSIQHKNQISRRAARALLQSNLDDRARFARLDPHPPGKILAPVRFTRLQFHILCY